MNLDLKNIFSGRADSLPFAFEMDMSDVEWDTVYPFVSPVGVKGSVHVDSAGVLLEAEAEFDFSMPCDRCAEIVKRHYTRMFSHILVSSLENEENDVYIQVQDDAVNVAELLRADILLEIPSKFLCRSDCKGLCPSCGKNLNEGSCDCNLHQVDPRLEALRKLID